MHIEPYSEKYYLDIITIVDNFHKEALCEYNDIFDRDIIKNTIINIGNNPACKAFLLIVNDKCEGVLAGLEIPSLYNNKRIFQELIWYINKSFRLHGVALLRKVEATLKESGINTIIMGVIENSKTDKIKQLYARMGYAMFETHWIRSI